MNEVEKGKGEQVINYERREGKGREGQGVAMYLGVTMNE
jgi:hypothetical protein